MQTKSFPNKLLIQIADRLYRDHKTAPYRGMTASEFTIMTEEIEPGMNPDDYVETLRQLQKDHIPSIKEIIFIPGGACIDIYEKIKPINLVVIPEKFSLELIKFIAQAKDHHRLISRDEDGTFYFKGDREMVPRNRKSKYWQIFESIYEIAMTGEEDGNHFFHAKYKPLRSALVKRKAIPRCSDSDYKKDNQTLRNFIKDQFRVRPQSFGLPQSSYHGKQIIQKEETGIKFYNPEI